MKVTITDREVKEVKREYPYFGKCSDGTIILFIAPKEGFCFTDPRVEINNARYSKAWGEYNFTPLVNKTITIEV